MTNLTMTVCDQPNDRRRRTIGLSAFRPIGPSQNLAVASPSGIRQQDVMQFQSE
jgi:hypothetical protein